MPRAPTPIDPHNLWFEVEDVAAAPEAGDDGAGRRRPPPPTAAPRDGAARRRPTAATQRRASTDAAAIDAPQAAPRAARAPAGDHSYDVVCAFSITKWVHLAHGDEGLLRLFRSAHARLRRRRRFVLEPQPWRSYRKAVGRDAGGAVARAHFEAIRVRPDQFERVLLSAEVGRSVERLGTPRGAVAQGCNARSVSSVRDANAARAALCGTRAALTISVAFRSGPRLLPDRSIRVPRLHPPSESREVCCCS